MATFILIIIFAIFSCIESITYGIYEFKVNKNKTAGIVLVVLSLVGVVFPIVMYVLIWGK